MTKLLFKLIVLIALLWVGSSFLNSNGQASAPTVSEIPVGPNLTIDGIPVTESFSFTNATVIDGDSVRVANANGEEFDLRLASLDAPELNQRFGVEAKQHLQNLLRNQKAVAWKIGTDQYNRLLVFLFIDQSESNPGANLFEINSQMIRDGFAWHYKQYSSSQTLDRFEYEARAARIGLWSDTAQPIPPWEFRNQ